MNVTNQHDLPELVFKALTHNSYSKGDSNRSVTTLIDSPRVRILRQEHAEEISEDVSDMAWAVLGTAVHSVFESQRAEGHVVEERLYHEIDNWVISGAIDLQRVEEDGSTTIIDYKCTSVWSVINGYKREWWLQLNFYAWLASVAKGVFVDKLQVIAVLRDWQRKKAEFDSSYPQSPIVAIDIPMMADEEVSQYVMERIKIHSDAEFERLTGGSIPLCSNEERWAKPTTYAVRKVGGKRAVRVFDSQAEAEEFLSKSHNCEIEERTGEFTRCKDNWCRVAQWCDQYQSEQEG